MRVIELELVVVVVAAAVVVVVVVVAVGHRLPGIWLRTGIAGLQYGSVSAETSSLFCLAEELPPDWDAGFVRMS